MPGILNLAFDGVDGETLRMAVASELACSSGSACNSVSVEPSFVLMALGVPRDLAFTALRFSFGRFTTEAESGKSRCLAGGASGFLALSCSCKFLKSV